MAQGNRLRRQEKRRKRRRRWRLLAEPLEPRCLLDATVVVNEIMYNPAGADESAEWIELYNEMSLDMSLSGWSLRGAVDFAFPEGTVLPGGDYLVVAADPAALASATGFTEALGPYVGRLSNGGEQIVLRDKSDRMMDAVRYEDRDPWPVGADGSGATLAKRDVDAGSGDPASWTASLQLGGTPGEVNFPRFDSTPERSTIVQVFGSWKYDSSDTAPTGPWTDVGFDDSAWSTGDAILAGGVLDVDLSAQPLPASGAALAPPVANAGFEDPQTGFGGGGNFYSDIPQWSDPVGAPAGVSSADNYTSTWLAGLDPPEGRQVAFVQGNGSFRQTITGLEPGKAYTVSYFENERGLVAEAMARPSVTFDGQTVVAEHEAVRTDRFRRIVSEPIVASGDSAELVFSNIGGAGDNSALFDDVRVTRAVPVVVNGNFELPDLSPDVFMYGPPDSGWTYSAAGVAHNGGGFMDGGVLAAEGDQAVFLQQVSSISQAIDGFEVGATYSLAWLQHARQAGLTPFGNDLTVTMADSSGTTTTLYEGDVLSSSWIEQEAVFVAQDTQYTLTLASTDAVSAVNPGDDRSILIDDVRFEFLAEPPETATSLAVGPTAYYFRHAFVFDADPALAQLTIDALVDDGAVVYLNGTEVARVNMPAGPVGHATPALIEADPSSFTGPITISTDSLRQGDNVLAVELHTAGSPDDDAAFALELTATVMPELPTVSAADFPSLALNEIAGTLDENFWIELVNFGDALADPSGYVLESTVDGNPPHSISVPAPLEPGERLLIGRADLGWTVTTGDRLFLLDAERTVLLDAVAVRDRPLARLPEGAGDWLIPSPATPGGANQFDLRNEIVINEIMYHQRSEPAAPLQSRRATPVALLSTWRFDASDVAPNSTWLDAGFDDGAWQTGEAILYVGSPAVDPTGVVEPAGAVIVENGGFESGALPAPPGYGPIVGWQTGGSTGVNDPTGPFINGLQVPEGNRVGFIQGQNEISQFVSGFEPGKSYTLEYWENERGHLGNPARPYATLDGTPVVEEHEVTRTDRFRRVISAPFLATAAAHPLVLGNANIATDASNDNTALFDEVRITRAVPLLANGNFEQYVLAAGTFEYAPAGSVDVGWLFTGPGDSDGDGGIARNGSVFSDNQPASDGNQMGLLQRDAAMAQTVTGFEPGVTYALAWAERMRTGFDGANDLEVVLDAGLPSEQVVYDAALVTNLLFEQRASDSFVATKGTYTVTFRTNNPASGDNTTLVDDVRFVFVADPVPLGDAMPPGASAYYLRQAFDFRDDPAATQLTLATLVDDGAVFYLNGEEVYRYNMPAGTIEHDTAATAEIASAGLTDPIAIPADGLVRGRNVLAVELHHASGSDDLAFAAELAAVTTTGGTPFIENGQEWIELFNRGGVPVDLGGWQLDDAVRFTFAPGTILPPNAFAVVAENPAALAAQFPDVADRIVGEFSGRLANDDERILLLDAVGNPADEVHYFDGGRWPEWADGGGASLELRDADADNSRAEAWAASREDGGSAWQTFLYRGIAAEPVGTNYPSVFHELILGLLDAGEVLIDDVSLLEDPDGAAIQRMQNGSFQADAFGTSPADWRIVGNHNQSRVIADPDDPANKVLNLVATGPTNQMHNHAETTLADGATIAVGQEYEISLRARWIAGSNQLNSRLYFDKLATTFLLDVPENIGTPGRPNSRAVANAGPTFEGLRHEPLIPAPGQEVAVSIRADDPDGVASLELRYSVNGGPWTGVPMLSAGQGTFVATVPAQGADATVQFYVAGADTLGAESTFPAEGTESRALYRVEPDDGPLAETHSLRLIMTPADVDLMYANWNVMSNDRLGATVVYDDRTVFYDVGVRLRASGYGRQGALAGFNIQFHPGQLFRGVQKTIAIDRGVVLSAGNGTPVQGTPGASPHELLINHISYAAGGIPAMYDDVIFIDAPRAVNSGPAQLKMARYGNGYLDSQFDNGSDGMLFKYELIYYADTTVDGDPEGLKVAPNAVMATDISDLGDDKEAYRPLFIVSNNRDRDDFDALIALAQAFSLTGAELDQRSREVMDVDQWMRVFAMYSLTGGADSYNMGLHHNLDLYVRPEDGKVLALPWDVDHGFFYDPTAPILGRGGSNLAKIIDLPHNRRLFYGHLLDLINTSYNVEHLGPWIDYYTRMTGFDLATFFTDYVDARANYVLEQLAQVAPQVPFEITTAGGADFTIDQNVATLEGRGWIDVHHVRLAGTGETVELQWLDQENWQLTLPVAAGANPFALVAFDYQGNPVGSDAIIVTSTVSDRPLEQFLRIAEIMYNPPDPTPAEQTAGFDDNDDFEFIELVNTGTSLLDLSGVAWTGGITFTFADGTMLPAGERILVVRNLAAFSTRYDTGGMNIAGEYRDLLTGGNKLSNNGETIRLADGVGAIIQEFAYNDGAAWPQSPDGLGSSLEIINTESDYDDPASWHAGVQVGGSPGVAATAVVVGRYVFYDGSVLDDPAAGGDDAAIATDKTALLPGQQATPANYTSFGTGMVGVMFDLAHAPDATSIDVDDLLLQVGNDDATAGWSGAPDATITIRPDEGRGGSDRIVLTWSENTIENAWLRVDVLATPLRTGLAESDVFYFGNAVGETGNSTTDTLVNAADVIAMRDNPRGPWNPASIDDPHDLNRDRSVDAVDLVLARDNATSPLSALRLITPSVASPAPRLPAYAEGRMFQPEGEGESMLAHGSSASTGTLPLEPLDGLMAAHTGQPAVDTLLPSPMLGKLLRRRFGFTVK